MRAAGHAPHEPAAIYRYLVPREQQVLTVRQHAAFLVPPAAAAAGAALAAGVVTVIAPGARTLEIVAWVLAGFLIARLIAAVLSWSVQYITVTNARVVLTSGVFTRKVKIIPLLNFAEMTFARSFAGRMFGYGTFIIEATGKAYLIIDYIPYSEQIQLLLTEGAFPKSAGSDWDVDDDESPSATRSASFGLADYGDYGTPAGYQEPPGAGHVVHAEAPPENETPPETDPGGAPDATDSEDPDRPADED